MFEYLVLIKQFWWTLPLIYIAYKIYSYFKIPNEYKWLPVVSTLDVWRSFFRRETLMQRSLGLYQPLMDKSGIILGRFGPRWMFTIGSPEVTKRVLTRPDLFPKVLPKMAGGFYERVLGTNVIFSNGPDWRHHRKIAAPAFKNGFNLNNFIDIGNNLITQWKSYKDGEEVLMYDWMQRFTIDILGKVIFGYEFNNLTSEDNHLLQKYNAVKDCIDNPFFSMMPWIGHLRFLPFVKKTFESLESIDATIFEMVAKRRQLLKESKIDEKHPYHSKEKDFLDLIVEANDGEDGISDKELRDNIFVFFVAGHDTTTQGLTSAMYLLAKHPDFQQKLRKSIEDLLPKDAPSDAVPSIEELKFSLPYLTAFIKETLRLYPSAGFLSARYAAQNNALLTSDGPGGNPVYVRKGDWVTINNMIQQRNPDFWDYPNLFIPDRFLDPEDRVDCKYDLKKPIYPYSWSPFGVGSRLCLGYEFSMLEQMVVLCMIVRNFELSLPKDSVHKDELQFQFGKFLCSPSLKIKLRKLETNQKENLTSNLSCRKGATFIEE